MPFSLEIQLEGLIVYFPCQTSGTADVALIGRPEQSPAGHSHAGDVHVPQFYLGAGAQPHAGNPPLPLFLEQFDIVVHDGSSPVTGRAALNRIRKFSAPLYRMFSADDLREGLLLSKHEKIAPNVAARIQLIRGKMLATNLTRDKWRLVEKPNKVIKKTERPLAKTFVFVTPILGDSATFYFFNGRNPGDAKAEHTVTVKPVAGADFARVHLANVANAGGSDGDEFKQGQKNNVPHFEMVLSVLKSQTVHPKRDCHLQQEDKEPIVAPEDVIEEAAFEEIRRLQLPCVGGCAC